MNKLAKLLKSRPILNKFTVDLKSSFTDLCGKKTIHFEVSALAKMLTDFGISFEKGTRGYENTVSHHFFPFKRHRIVITCGHISRCNRKKSIQFNTGIMRNCSRAILII